MVDLDELVTEHLRAARADQRGRSAALVVHDGELRQSIIALVEGAELPAHNSPPAGSIQVLAGRIRVATGGANRGETRRVLRAGELGAGEVGASEPGAGELGASELGAGELWLLTHERHAVIALEDSAFLLTTVTGVGRESFS